MQAIQHRNKQRRGMESVGCGMTSADLSRIDAIIGKLRRESEFIAVRQMLAESEKRIKELDDMLNYNGILTDKVLNENIVMIVKLQELGIDPKTLGVEVPE